MQRYQDIWVFPVPVEGGGPVEDKAKKGGAKPEAKDAATADEAQDAEPEYPKRLTSKVGPFTSPSWSPDGRFIAFVGHDMEHVWYSDDRLWLVEVAPDCSPKGKARCLTKDFERSFNDQSVTDMRVAGSDTRPRWSPDGKFIFLLASDRGTTHLHMVETSTGKVRQLTTGDWVIFNWSADAGLKNFAFALARPDNPSDIYVGRLPEGSDPAKWPVAPAGLADLDVISRQPVTRTNADLLKKHPVSRPERFTFAAPGGSLVDGWTIRPVDYQEGRRYPCVLQIHGGPMAMYTGTFFFEFQLLAARGIGVIYCNPRGSQGYGQEFCAGIRDEWGVNDYADIMACVDTAIKQLGWVDPDRLGVAGGSYGGYMTSWIIGHTDRFKAACSMRAVNNCHSFYGTSDTGFQWDDIWHGKPWEKWENLIKQSPITYAGNIKTPTLIIHSEEDHRCLIEQGEQLFIALKKLGVEAEFLRYPGESHGLSRQGKPWHRIHRLKRIVEWFEKHL
jgi:dipeptidyl aminopeptidase/acylaminoacyl peptidase